MALDTCAGLKEAAASWLARTGDTQITTNVADFVLMAEGYFNRHLRVRQMETLMTFTTTNGSTNLPDDYLAWRRMTWVGSPYSTLEYVTPDVLHLTHSTVQAGTPSRFTIEGSNIVVRDTNDTTGFEFLYYAKIPALEDDTDTNWLLLAHPDLYLSAVLAEANAFLINPEHAALWAEKRNSICDEVSALSEKTKGPSRMIPVGGAIY